MNVYVRLGNHRGSAEARELARQLVAWHDAMVRHLRVAGRRRSANCGEECPHDEAAALWADARDIFGSRAQELEFLRTHGRRTRINSMQPAQPSGLGVRV
jgi:hypothetical protein